jgi:hypothetical protein
MKMVALESFKFRLREFALLFMFKLSSLKMPLDNSLDSNETTRVYPGPMNQFLKL